MTVSDLLFNAPWWLIGLLILGGGYGWYVGNQRRDKAIQSVSSVAAAVGVVLIALGLLVTTDRQRIEKQTRQIVQAVNDQNWNRLNSLLSARTDVAGIYNNRDAILEGIKKTTETIGLSSVKISSLTATQTDTVITVDLTVLTAQEVSMDRPVPSSWRFNWSNRGTGWQLDHIEPLDGRQMSKNDLMQEMRH